MAHLHGRAISRIAIGLALAASSVSAARAAPSVEDFYRGKQVSMIIYTSAGGTYDLYARLLSRPASNVFDTQISSDYSMTSTRSSSIRVFGLVHLRMASFMCRVKFLMRFSSRVMCAILLCATTICQVLRWP